MGRVWLNVQLLDGSPLRIPSIPGESLLTSLKRYKIDGIIDDCTGGDPEYPSHQIPYDFYSVGPSCGKCQVYLKEPHYHAIPMTQIERDVIDGNYSMTTDR